MGSLPSKRPATHLGARLTSVTIEKYYNALARRRTAGEQANSSEQSHDDQINNKDTNNASSCYGSKIREITDNNDTKKASDAHLFKETPKCDTTAITPKRVGSKVLRNVGTRPDDRGMANLYRDSAPHILKAADKCRIDRALILTIKSGFDSKRLTEAAMAWIKKHPWEPAAVFVPLAFLACMPSILGTAGFRAGGIAPGKRTCFPRSPNARVLTLRQIAWQQISRPVLAMSQQIPPSPFSPVRPWAAMALPLSLDRSGRYRRCALVLLLPGSGGEVQGIVNTLALLPRILSLNKA
jgi:hypothetical protein